MNEALEVFYYVLNKTYNFLFGAYLFDGVSIGMLGVVGFVFTVLLQFLLAVPKIQVADHRPVETWSEDSGYHHLDVNGNWTEGTIRYSRKMGK